VIDRRVAWSLPALLVVVVGIAWALGRGAEPVARAPLEEPPSEALTAPEPPRAAAPPPVDGLRWIVAGEGDVPELNQVQIEQDLALATETLSAHGPGLLLYAGGADGAPVQVLRDAGEAGGLRGRLGELFDPRGGRDSAYRPSTLEPAGAARAEAILSAVRGAIADDDAAPLTVYLAGHGVGGEAAYESRFLTWGHGEIDVDALTATLDEVSDHRPVRFVITSCHAGGFAEMAFAGADPEQGAAPTDRCGFFATTWDRAAAGCDPNPDRGAQEGYGIHFLHALRGEDRQGEDARAEIDLDGDSVITLAEAHARARIASGSLDVPVTTSERFLRAAVPEPADVPEGRPPASLPVERAVVAALTERAGLERPEDVIVALDSLHEEVRPLAAELETLDAELDQVRADLVAELLHRWPVLDDPWHPDFEPTLADEAAAIEAHLEGSGLAARERELEGRRVGVAERHDDLLIEAAPLERLERALETLELAARLQAEGGTWWLRYLRFVACESGRL